MPPSSPLDQLRSLDWGSPELHDQISNIFYGVEYRKWVENLGGGDLAGIVDYLDTVCPHGLFFPSRLKLP